jgi:hypothetical protein
MQRESNTTGIKGGPGIRPIRSRFDAEHFSIEPLHALKILEVEHCAS